MEVLIHPRESLVRMTSAGDEGREQDYMKFHNNEPKPLVWTATAESILTKVRRGRVALNQVLSQ